MPWSDAQREAFLASLDDDDNESPLLAESTDEMDPDMVEALMQLRDGDDPPEVLAEEAKKRGNKHFSTAQKTKKNMWFKEAAKEYTDGIALCRAAGAPELEATLWSNRAACALGLRNFGDAKRDCHQSLKLKPNVKALYRLAKACFALKQFEQAQKAADWGLSLETTRELEHIAKHARLKLDELRHKKQEHTEFFESLQNIGVRIGPTTDLPTIQNDDGMSFFWPVIIEYPQEDMPPDFIKQIGTDDLIAHWLIQLFEHSPAWDANDDYIATNIALYCRQPSHLVYFETAQEYVRYRIDGDAPLASEEGEVWIALDPALTLRDLLTFSKFVYTGPIKFQARPKNSQEHANWRQQNTPISLLDSIDYTVGY